MKSIRRFLVFAIVCCSSHLLSAQLKFPSQIRKPPNPKSLHITAQKMFAPYWTAEPGWHSEIQLRNNLISGSLVVTPVLRLADGREYALSPQTIAPSDVVSVDVADELQKKYNLAGQAGTYGWCFCATMPARIETYMRPSWCMRSASPSDFTSMLSERTRKIPAQLRKASGGCRGLA